MRLQQNKELLTKYTTIYNYKGRKASSKIKGKHRIIIVFIKTTTPNKLRNFILAAEYKL